MDAEAILAAHRRTEADLVSISAEADELGKNEKEEGERAEQGGQRYGDGGGGEGRQ